MDLDAVECLKRQEKKRKRGVIKDDLDLRTEKLLKDRRVKTMIDFEYNDCNSIKSLAIKKTLTLKLPLVLLKVKC